MIRRLFVVPCLIALTVTAASQTTRGASIAGTVSGPDGNPVADAPIQVRNAETGAVMRTASSHTGQYTFGGLPAGTYDLSIAVPCCTFDFFSKGGVQLRAGEKLSFDIHLKEGSSLNTLGDDPAVQAAFVRKRTALRAQPVPRTAQGRVDLSGVWLMNEDRYPEQPEALPWAAAIAKERIANNVKDHPHTRCLPGSPPVPYAAPPFMAKFVQTPKLLVILFEDVPGFRQVYLDTRSHPATFNPSWLGHAVGKWQGDTLVIDTVGFNDRSWIGIYPHTEMMHITERYRRRDFGHLDIVVTVEDRGAFVKPWSMNMTWEYAPQEDIFEYVCENNKPEHIVGDR